MPVLVYFWICRIVKGKRLTESQLDLYFITIKISGSLPLQRSWEFHHHENTKRNVIIYPINKNFQTWLLNGWQQSPQPIRSDVGKSLLTNINLNTSILLIIGPPMMFFFKCSCLLTWILFSNPGHTGKLKLSSLICPLYQRYIYWTLQNVFNRSIE